MEKHTQIVSKNTSVKISHDNGKNTIDGKPYQWDVKKITENSYHIIKDHKSYSVEILKINKEEKEYFLKVNGKKIKLNAVDPIDQLLKKLGISGNTNKKIKDLKAPMPGLVVAIEVAVGDEVSEGQPLIILEAMKMENSLKSPTQGIVKSIEINAGETVDKNKILLSFE